MRKRTKLFALLMSIANLQCGQSTRDSDPTTPDANVLLYVVDTLRADALGAYGGENARTPAVDRLALEGVLFERAYSPTSWTRPAMASLLTGTLPPYHGTLTRKHHLPQEIETLAEALREQGYATVFITANPNVAAHFGFGQGFDDTIELFDRRTPGRVKDSELIARSAEVDARLEKWLEDAPRPFFVVVLTVDPHFPHTPPDDWVDGDEERLDMDTVLAEKSLSPAMMRRVKSEYLRLYRAEVAFNDDSFGRLIDRLRASGELDETIVVFTADHGEEFWEHGRFGHGYTLHDEVLRVPLVMRFPGIREPGRRVERVVGTVDVLPTILGLLGLPPIAAASGSSLLNEHEHGVDPVFASLSLEGSQLQSVTDGRWKLVLDRKSGVSHLYDTQTDQRENSPVRVNAVGPPAKARSRLLQSLREIAARRSGFDTAGPRGSAKLPEAVGEALEALGYIE